MRVLIIGCGSIGRRHAVNASSHCEVGLFDANLDLSLQLAAELGIQSFPSLEEALRSKPDGVIIATPNDIHLSMAEAAVRSGAHVMIEKPISNSLAGVANFLDYAESMSRKVFVVCNMRFHPGIDSLRKHLGAIGGVLFSRAYYGNYLPDMRPGADYRTLYCASKDQGGGVILDAIHEFDYLTWLLGAVELVTADAGTLGDLEIETEDYASISMRHGGGIRSEIHVDYLQRWKRRGCEVVGTQGTLVWQSEGKRPEQCEVRLYTTETRQWSRVFYSDDLDPNRPYELLMREYMQGLAGGDAPTLLRGRQALTVLASALAAKEAAASNQAVRPDSLS
jgi:predicted dehydrogenase